MSFKVAMLVLACEQGKLVFDHARYVRGLQGFARVKRVKGTDLCLEYLDGHIAPLIRNQFNQMEPINPPTVLSTELLIHQLDCARFDGVSLDQVLFGGDLLPQEVLKKIAGNTTETA